MASDQQVSLAVAPRGGSSHLNRPARQVVPAFLQKLYEMVNDHANHDLIRWSDTGDSFFVLDQERFASDVLGRWFKHKNFSSFVRQLNMYGFHKITHLQQGVLRSDNETEFWNFEHPNFLRGQPDLLCLIQRKKQTTQSADEVASASRDTTNGSTAVGNLSAGQILDINSIVNGIAVIKRHQTAISADLNELKNSNQHLWQEAMAARERHKKHQDTINRILKFLAGVFGHADSPIRKENGSHSPSHAVVSRKPQRLMIADGPAKKRSVEINEIVDEESRSSMNTNLSPPDYFSSTDTPVSNATHESSVVPSEIFASSREASPRFMSIEPPIARFSSGESFVASNTTNKTDSARTQDSIRMQDSTRMQEPYASQSPQFGALHGQPTQPTQTAPPNSNSLTTTNPPNNNDAMVQAALAQMLQSPTQMQRLLAALSAQSNYAIPEMPAPPLPQHTSQLTPYDPSMDVSRGFNPEQYNASFSPSSLSLLAPSAADEIVPFEPLVESEDRLQKTYRDAAEIDADVNALHSSINSLIESLGMDPNAMNTSNTVSQDMPFTDGSVDGPLDHGQGDPGQDFDFDAFFTDLSRSGDEDADLDRLADKLDPSVAHTDAPTKLNNPSPEQLHAFLDEVASQDGTTGSMPGQMHSSPVAPMSQNRKRKSDVADIGTTVPGGVASVNGNQSMPGQKAKKKR